MSYLVDEVSVRCFEIMVSTKKNEDAVSPVIGVILMVAVTVILAAIIAAFVFGMAGNVQSTKVVAISLERANTSGVIATNMGGSDAVSFIGVNWTIDGTPNVDIDAWSGSPIAVGSIKFVNAPVGARVIGIGSFSDGTTQVIVDKTI